MAQRHGHTAATSASVLEILKQTQAAGTRFSHTERVLYTACEFWVATSNHALTRFVGNVPKIVLRDAEAAFAAIGIPSVADMLRDARNSLVAATPAVHAWDILAQLQHRLDHLAEPIDEMIGRFAAEQTWSRLKQPTFEPGLFGAGAPAEARTR
jgi:hypothetical protein